MENRAYMEPLEKRTNRFQKGPPNEIIETLLNSIDNFFNNEIRLTTEDDHYQTTLLFLGIHAVALTISDGFFNKTGLDGYKLFLESFVDGNTRDTQFSHIAKLIHKWRNIIAHQWLGVSGHKISYDYNMSLGWEVRNKVTFINPKIYRDCYLKAFSSEGSIWNYREMFTDEDLLLIKDRLLKKFLIK